MDSIGHSGNNFAEDPSIVQVSSEGEPGGKLPSGANGKLEPGSALSKLLDSAMAKAAKESTPEVEPRSRSESPIDKGGSEDTTATTTAAAIATATAGAGDGDDDGDGDRVYTIEYLLTLKDLPYIKSYKNSSELPDKGFWRTKAKYHGSLSNPKEHFPTTKHGSGHNKKGGPGKKKLDQIHSWERKSGFIKDGELDVLSNDKISELLDEPLDEAEPEWGDAELNDDEFKMDMGQTVEDFEKWKTFMKNEERKKNGEVFESQLDTNEVDSFFSFVKPKSSKSESATPRKEIQSGLSTPGSAKPETLSKSSRFSSFFGTPADSKDQVNTNQSGLNPASVPQRNAPDEIPSNFEQGSSRFASIIGHDSQENQINSPASNAESTQRLPTQMNNPAGGMQPQNNDAFFMSLLNKKEKTNSNGILQGPAVFNSVPGGANSPQNAHEKGPINGPGIYPEGDGSDIKRKDQHPNIPQHFPAPQQLPPWMHQFQNGPNNMTTVGRPREDQSKQGNLSMLTPSQAPSQAPSQMPRQGPIPQNMPFPPNMGRIPPEMFARGFVPPPGMPMPPQFVNHGGIPSPSPNHMYMGPPMGMANPPPPPPPPGFGVPPAQNRGDVNKNSRYGPGQ